MSNRQTPRTCKQSPWRQPYFWLVVTLPATAVVAGVLTLILALRSSDGLVADDYYKKGMQINQVLHRDRKAQDYALTAQLEVDSNSHVLRVQLRGNDAFRYPDHATLRLLHPTRAGYDTVTTLQHISGAEYSGPYIAADHGLRHAQIEADDWRLLLPGRLP